MELEGEVTNPQEQSLDWTRAEVVSYYRQMWQNSATKIGLPELESRTTASSEFKNGNRVETSNWFRISVLQGQ